MVTRDERENPLGPLREAENLTTVGGIQTAPTLLEQVLNSLGSPPRGAPNQEGTPNQNNFATPGDHRVAARPELHHNNVAPRTPNRSPSTLTEQRPSAVFTIFCSPTPKTPSSVTSSPSRSQHFSPMGFAIGTSSPTISGSSITPPSSPLPATQLVFGHIPEVGSTAVPSLLDDEQQVPTTVAEAPTAQALNGRNPAQTRSSDDGEENGRRVRHRSNNGYSEGRHHGAQDASPQPSVHQSTNPAQPPSSELQNSTVTMLEARAIARYGITPGVPPQSNLWR